MNEKPYYEIRMDICKKCEYLIPYVNRCKQCGCFMDLKTKIKNVRCPLSLWVEVNENK